ncbi:hypothetical protein GCM10009719_34630 [Nocardioides kribbensis]
MVDAEYCWRRLTPGTAGTLGTSLETEDFAMGPPYVAAATGRWRRVGGITPDRAQVTPVVLGYRRYAALPSVRTHGT